MNHQNNTWRIKTVYNSLGDLRDQVVFVGGSTVSFYADQETLEVRETDDVDVIVEVVSFSEHANFEEKLRARGFSPDVNSKVRIRYRVKNVAVDFMPTTNIAVGFENKWYQDGFQKAMDYQIDDNTVIKILTAPYFIATKLEAFKNRGATDPRQSHDFEDIVYVLENRTAVWSDLLNTDNTLKAYLRDEFAKLLSQPGIYEWIDCHVDFVSPPPTDMIIEELQRFCTNA